MMQIHKLKISDVHWERIMEGEKTCEIRLNDRDFQVGDLIRFKTDWTKAHELPEEAIFEDGWMIHECEWEITHVLHFPEGLCPGYVALSIKSNPKKQ